MERIFEFGKIPYTSSNSSNRVKVKIALTYSKNDPEKPVFSAQGFIYDRCTIISSGQNLDTIARYIKNNSLFDKIYRLWNLYHLNDLHAGTPEQESALKQAVINHELNSYGANNYKESCDYLKQKNLYEISYQGKPYKYGHGWIYYPIPEHDLKSIKELFSVTI